MTEQIRRRRPFWYLRRRPATLASEIDEELNVHLAMRVEELRADGLSPDAARREAIRQFGNLDYTRRYCQRQGLQKEKRMQRGLLLEDLIQDLRIGLRSLLRAPMMTMTIVVTVGLGIGATTVIFSAVHAALLRPLPYADPARLVRIYTDAPPNKFRFSVADYLALEAQQSQFERIAGYTDRAMAFSDGAVAERVRGRMVSWPYFALLGIRPVIGRDFTELDGRPGRPPSVIVSHGFWQRRLGGRLDAIGRSIRLDGSNYAVAGVLPQAVGPLERGQEFFVAAQFDTPQRKGPFFIIVIGRLKDGARQSPAADELRAISRRIFPLWRASYQDERASWSMMDLKAHVTGDVGTIAGVALGSVGLVWLIACTNASNLLVARVTSRRRELAVRAALGASRGRVVRYLLAESWLLATAAAGVGIALASAGIALLRDLGAGYFPRTQEIALDGAAVSLLCAFTAFSALIFGLIPAVHGTGGSVEESLRSMGRSSTGSVAVRRLRHVLVGSQYAIATPLLVVAGLLLSSLHQLARVDLGFDSRNLISGSIALPPAQYDGPARVADFWDDLRRRIEALPGVAEVAFADGRPPNDAGNFNNFDLEAFPTPRGQSQPVTPWIAVSREYFRLLGLTVVDGRLFDERDGRGPNVEAVVVDRAWAARFFPNESAVGKRFRQGGCSACPWTTVVGVVSDVKYAGLDKPDEGSVYSPMPGRESLRPARFRYVLVRTSSDAAPVLPVLQRVVRQLDPSLPFSNVATIDELVAQSLQRPRSLSLLIGSLAAVALILSIVGVYGVMAYYVQQHMKDICIRLALGGSPGEVLRLIVGQGLKVVAAGVAVGFLIALVTARLMSSLLFGVGSADAVTLGVIGALLIGVALVACLLPARRAIGLQPAAVLRNE
jgi:predicted permease